MFVVEFPVTLVVVVVDDVGYFFSPNDE